MANFLQLAEHGIRGACPCYRTLRIPLPKYYLHCALKLANITYNRLFGSLEKDFKNFKDLLQ